MGGIILWIPTAFGREDLDSIAYTDGQKIYYCDAFFMLPEDQQYAVVIHETLHVALRHPTRFKKLYMQLGDKFNSYIANMCADAIVIRAIKNVPNIGPLKITNPYLITAEDIVEPADLKKIPAQLWTFEMLYSYMSKKNDQQIEAFMKKHDLKNRRDLFEYLMKDGDGHKEDMETGVWRERMRRAGTSPDSILREVSGDIPDTKTPWERLFKEFMIAHVMPTTTTDWARPSRRLLASKGTLGYYEPGIQRELGVKKAGIIFDTSGSIGPDEFNHFIAECNMIMEQTGCYCLVICADADVQSITEFRDKITSKYEAKGGGGTDFIPAIEELEKHEIDCCVYFTDMCGTFPEKPPSYPIMWATLNKNMDPPFGIKVVVEPKI